MKRRLPALRDLVPDLGSGPWRTYILYAAAVLGVILLTALALRPAMSLLIGDWARRDVELRSRLIFNSIRDQVALHLASSSDAALSAFFERLTEDERILGLAFCDAEGRLRAATRLMPSTFSCETLARGDAASFSTSDNGGRSTSVASFPIGVQGVHGHLAVVHDLSFVRRRASQARNYWSLAMAALVTALGALAGLFAYVLIGHWRREVGRSIRAARAGEAAGFAGDGLAVFGPELRQVLRELRVGSAAPGAGHVDWSPSTLSGLLGAELPGAEVMVVSNREPYIHNVVDGRIELQIPASGLVAALEPVVRATGGTWIAHGSGTADRETVDAHDRIQVPPANPAYTLRRLWLTEEEQNGYYYGFANEGLWPLCHISFVRPNFREPDWQVYRAVNKRFANAVADEAKVDDPIVLVQDYHLALLPRMLRKRLPRATILTFWHVPWPNAETFSICPWKDEIIDGLLGSDVIGFHTQFHCNNFLEAVDRFVESRIDREQDAVFLRGAETVVRPYPISIEWPPAALATQAPVEACRRAVGERFGLAPEVRIGVGVERFDYTKGVTDRLRGIDEFLTRHPEWRGRFVFIQAAAPTRSQLASYRDLQQEAVELTEAINRRHGVDGFDPIRLVIRHHEPAEVFELFRASDVCVVSSLHDGMNLVAKEFVAARDDEHGVLILSHFAGASRELSEALIVNPYDSHALGEAMQAALQMPREEQRARMRLMRELVRERNVYRWAGQMLLDAARLRRRQRVIDIIGTKRLAITR